MRNDRFKSLLYISDDLKTKNVNSVIIFYGYLFYRASFVISKNNLLFDITRITLYGITI